MKEKLPKKYIKIYERALTYLQDGRPGDVEHALDVALSVIEYSSGLGVDVDVLVPVALMHDIGHSAILPEHFKYVTGPYKLPNGKLVHMLAGAKIAKKILEDVRYDAKKSEEIVEIISMHDFDQLKYEGKDISEIFDTDNKKFFHDVDSLDRYSIERIRKFQKMFPDKTSEDIFKLVEEVTTFFFDEIKAVAQKRSDEIRKQI